MKPILINCPMPITTPRLLIRPPLPGDGKMLNEAVLESFETLQRTLAWATNKPTVDESEEVARQAAANWILKKDEEPYLPLFIFDRESNHFIGATGFHHIDWEVPCLEIGYWIRDTRSGNGYMTEAINAITRYAVVQLGMKRVAITCDIENIKSRKICERLGFHLEATLKAKRISPLTGKISDTLVFVRHGLSNLTDLSVSWEK